MNIHHKPISLLNVNKFYDGLITFIKHVINNHFISFTVEKLFICALITNELLDFLKAYRLELDPKTFLLDWLADNGRRSSKNHNWI